MVVLEQEGATKMVVPAEVVVVAKPVQELLDRMELGNAKVLMLVEELDEKVALSTRNIPTGPHLGMSGT